MLTLLRDRAESVKLDAERLAHHAGRPVAADEIARAHGLRGARRRVGQRHIDAVVVLLNAVEAGVVAKRHVRQSCARADEDRIEVDLRAGAGRFRRVVARSRCA